MPLSYSDCNYFIVISYHAQRISSGFDIINVCDRISIKKKRRKKMSKHKYDKRMKAQRHKNK